MPTSIAHCHLATGLRPVSELGGGLRGGLGHKIDQGKSTPWEASSRLYQWRVGDCQQLVFGDILVGLDMEMCPLCPIIRRGAVNARAGNQGQTHFEIVGWPYSFVLLIGVPR